MSRRSSKPSNVVPISLADELDELMSSESIKPNLAFLGLSPEGATETTTNPVAPDVHQDRPSSAQPRLVVRSEATAATRTEKSGSTPHITAPVADADADVERDNVQGRSGTPATDAVITDDAGSVATNKVAGLSWITAPAAYTFQGLQEHSEAPASDAVKSDP